MSLIDKAYKFAEERHKNQVRKFNKEPFFNHCKRVRESVERYLQEENISCACLLHDTVEDTDTTLDEITQEFNHDIAVIVDELTNKFTKETYPFWSRKQRKSRELGRIRNISEKAQIIKLADRIDNVKSFIKDDPKWRQGHYYHNETKDLVHAFWKNRQTNPIIEILCTELESLL